MSTREERLQQHHNAGQADQADGKGYNAPHGVLKGVVTFGEEAKRDVEDNVAYRQGWENAEAQNKK
jgi:hypothetical protein